MSDYMHSVKNSFGRGQWGRLLTWGPAPSLLSSLRTAPGLGTTVLPGFATTTSRESRLARSKLVERR